MVMFTREAEVNAAVSASKDVLHLDNISKIYAYPFDEANSYLDLADFIALLKQTERTVPKSDFDYLSVVGSLVKLKSTLLYRHRKTRCI
jgi:hypothetical protein